MYSYVKKKKRSHQAFFMFLNIKTAAPHTSFVFSSILLVLFTFLCEDKRSLASLYQMCLFLDYILPSFYRYYRIMCKQLCRCNFFHSTFILLTFVLKKSCWFESGSLNESKSNIGILIQITYYVFSLYCTVPVILSRVTVLMVLLVPDPVT